MNTEVDNGSGRSNSQAPHRRRLAVALGLLLAAAAVVAIVLGTRSSAPRAADNTSSVVGAAIVQRRNLVETDTESGTLGYANPQTVYNRLSGTVTWLPAVGRVVGPGQTLYGINERPVVLFDGALPAYRALTDKDSAGRDVLQLNRDLVQMGFAEGQITIDDAWQAGTTGAVKRWQASLGEKQTGKIALGEIVFLPGPQLVTQLDTTCGSTGGGPSGGSSSGGGSGPTNGCGISEASVTTPAWHPEFIDFAASSTTTTTTTTPATTGPTTTGPTTTGPTTTGPTTTGPTTAGPTTTTTTTSTSTSKAPSGHKPSGAGAGNGSASGKSSGSSGSKTSGSGKSSSSSTSSRSASNSGSGKSSGGSGNGNSAESASAILQTTSTELVVTVDLAASSQSEAIVGSQVTVEMPNGSTVGGTIAAVSSVAQNSSNGNGNAGNNGNNGSGSSATIPVTITFDGPAKGAGLDQAAVSVNFAQARANNVLSVPVTALVATSGESFAVQQASPPYTLVPVTTGLFAAGYVEISGPGVHAGFQVTDSQG